MKRLLLVILFLSSALFAQEIAPGEDTRRLSVSYLAPFNAKRLADLSGSELSVATKFKELWLDIFYSSVSGDFSPSASIRELSVRLRPKDTTSGVRREL